MRVVQKIKKFFSRLFLKKRKRRTFVEYKVFELHAKVAGLEKKLALAQQDIGELSSLVNKMSKVQYDLANSYNSMIGEVYGSFEKDLTQASTGMLLFGIGPDDDDA